MNDLRIALWGTLSYFREGFFSNQIVVYYLYTRFPLDENPRSVYLLGTWCTRCRLVTLRRKFIYEAFRSRFCPRPFRRCRSRR